MNPILKTLILGFLRELQEYYSNNSCNDYNLFYIIPDDETRAAFLQLVSDHYRKENDDELLVEDGCVVADGAVLNYVISQLKVL